MDTKWGGYLSYVDTKTGYEHRVIRVEHGWKLRIEKKQSGELIHEENGCKDVIEAQERDKVWTEKSVNG